MKFDKRKFFDEIEMLMNSLTKCLGVLFLSIPIWKYHFIIMTLKNSYIHLIQQSP